MSNTRQHDGARRASARPDATRRPRSIGLQRRPGPERLEHRQLLATSGFLYGGFSAEGPDQETSSQPLELAKDPSGNVWITEAADNNIGELSSDGALNQFAIPTPSSGPVGITLGPDGNLWFTESLGDKIGRITPPASSPSSTSSRPAPYRPASPRGRMATSGSRRAGRTRSAQSAPRVSSSTSSR